VSPPNVISSHAAATPPLAGHVPEKIISSALNGECVELYELLDKHNENRNEMKSVFDADGYVFFKNVKQKKMITSAYKWLEAWCVYEVILSHAYGFDMMHEMASYRSLILNLFQRFKIPPVLSYDARHRHSLAIRGSFRFSAINYDIYLECFDSSALKGGNRCSRCSAYDHDQNDCPFRPATSGADSVSKKVSSKVVPTEVCKNFQDAKCRFGGRCHRRHVCIVCGGSEGRSSCPVCAKTKSSA